RPRLVLDKAPQLGESPGGERRPLWLSGPYPRANVRQVLQRDRSLRVFGCGDDLCADRVVDVALKARLLPSALLHDALRTLCARALQARSGAAIATAKRKDSGSRILIPVRVRGDVDDAQVHAEMSDVPRTTSRAAAGGCGAPAQSAPEKPYHTGR